MPESEIAVLATVQKSWHNITTRCHILQYILLASIEFDGQKGSGKSQLLIYEAISLIFRKEYE